MDGVFITFEGGDGAGKTTQVELLESWLLSKGREVLRTREPGGSNLGVSIREILLNTNEDVTAKAEALLYAADRAQHIETVVKPALSAGKVVVQDRYIDSSLAYQGAGRVLDAEEIEKLSVWATGNLWPHLTVLLDIDPQSALKRTQNRGAADRIERETIEFHEAVRNGFLVLAEKHPERYLVCDAAAPIEQIADIICERVKSLIS